MTKEFELHGCIEVHPSVTKEEFISEFIAFVESKSWFYGGGIHELIDGKYVLPKRSDLND